jgi:integrase
MTRANGLPSRVYAKHGAYYFVDQLNKWHRLCRVSDGLPSMYRALATRTEELKREGMVPHAVKEWLDDPRNKWAPKTRKEHEAMGAVIADAFAEFHCQNVTTAACAQFLEIWAKRGQARTHNKYRTCLTQVMRKAALKGWFTGSNPVREVPTMSTPGRKQIVTDDDIAKIKACAMVGKDGKPTLSGRALCQMVDLAMLTGQRISDVLKMRWQDVTPDGLYIEQGKGGGRVRILIEITPTLRAVIDSCAEGTERIGHLIKKTREGRSKGSKTAPGSSYTYAGMRSAWVRACERAGIDLDALHIHDMRGRAGVDKTAAEGKEAAQKLLGHANMKTTEHYVEGKTIARVKPTK